MGRWAGGQEVRQAGMLAVLLTGARQFQKWDTVLDTQRYTSGGMSPVSRSLMHQFFQLLHCIQGALATQWTDKKTSPSTPSADPSLSLSPSLVAGRLRLASAV